MTRPWLVVALMGGLALGLSGCIMPPWGSLIGDKSKGMADRPYFVTYEKTVPDVVRRGAETGDAGAQAAAGYFSEKGENGFPKRDDEALRFYRLAAAQENPAGLTNLAVFVARGREVRRDDVEAVRLLSLAARQDFEPAQLYLTAFYLAHRGNITDGDPVALAAVKAVVDRLMGSRLCPSDYHFVLAIARLYEDGTSGLPRDLNEARRLYERMAASFPAGCERPEARERLAKMSENSTLYRQ